MTCSERWCWPEDDLTGYTPWANLGNKERKHQYWVYRFIPITYCVKTSRFHLWWKWKGCPSSSWISLDRTQSVHQSQMSHQCNYNTFWTETFHLEVEHVGWAFRVNHLSCNGLSWTEWKNNLSVDGFVHQSCVNSSFVNQCTEQTQQMTALKHKPPRPLSTE